VTTYADGAWHQLEGDSPEEWEALKVARAAGRTCGWEAEAEAELVALAKRLDVPLQVERRNARKARP
jgi:hypothetical protein